MIDIKLNEGYISRYDIQGDAHQILAEFLVAFRKYYFDLKSKNPMEGICFRRCMEDVVISGQLFSDNLSEQDDVNISDIIELLDSLFGGKKE